MSKISIHDHRSMFARSKGSTGSEDGLSFQQEYDALLREIEMHIEEEAKNWVKAKIKARLISAVCTEIVCTHFYYHNLCEHVDDSSNLSRSKARGDKFKEILLEEYKSNVQLVEKRFDKLSEGDSEILDRYLKRVKEELGIDESTKSTIETELREQNAKDIVGSGEFCSKRMPKLLTDTSKLCDSPNYAKGCSDFWERYTKPWEDAQHIEDSVTELHKECCESFINAKRKLEELPTKCKGEANQLKGLEKQKKKFKDLKRDVRLKYEEVKYQAESFNLPTKKRHFTQACPPNPRSWPIVHTTE
ncbi:uncharacterized protein FOMMEDRAFT_31556 [Fomitiporia mediterranea MF3/22]|uniref:uncharacterized protein n=1 Tax=Fomitiporia mediterranea (strain MF3/22) TaxID=694068 RepID=UPI000440956B|nr:uncharacterized protein FOMMEDRAFT_31556 [Fomitiporia mediterranea MF3/22]EJC99003.1 hypothetical protein FOMMEDRAFT_31556 [Fomitiporia mediterranea MF3/22]